jgi:hypothetical protein
MRIQGIDAVGLYEARRQFLIDKWSTVSRISAGPLREIAKVALPTY